MMMVIFEGDECFAFFDVWTLLKGFGIGDIRSRQDALESFETVKSSVSKQLQIRRNMQQDKEQSITFAIM
jgi:hypothetical protein